MLYIDITTDLMKIYKVCCTTHMYNFWLVHAWHSHSILEQALKFRLVIDQSFQLLCVSLWKHHPHDFRWGHLTFQDLCHGNSFGVFDITHLYDQIRGKLFHLKFAQSANERPERETMYHVLSATHGRQVKFALVIIILIPYQAESLRFAGPYSREFLPILENVSSSESHQTVVSEFIILHFGLWTGFLYKQWRAGTVNKSSKNLLRK